jgi:integrase
MPRKPKAATTELINANGTMVRVTLFPPDRSRNERSWYVYWKGQPTRRSTKKATKAEAIEVVRKMLCEQRETPTATLTDEEFITIQRSYFEKQKTGRDRPESCDASLANVLEAIDAFKRISGLEHVSLATPDDCERFQTAALQLPANWRRPPDHKYGKTKTLSPFTVYKWLGALQGAFERANRAAGKKCVRGIVLQEKLLASNPWNEFTWIPKPRAKPRKFNQQELLELIAYFRTTWPGVTAAELMLKLFVWSWARRREVSAVKFEDIRIVDGIHYIYLATKRQGEKWFRLPASVHEELISIRTASPYVFAALSDQLRSHHQTRGNSKAARQVMEFAPENAGRWFYERIKAWSSGDSYVHMLRKTIMQMARAGEDVNLAVAKDASVTKGVMLDHYVSEDDPEMRAKADRMYRRICDGLTPKVAEAFGHRRSGTEEIERQLRDAVAAKDWERAKRLSGQLAKQGRQAG